MQNPVGAVEPRRGCEGGGGGTGAVQVAWPTAFAASLKLDSSYKGSGLSVRSRFAKASGRAQISPAMKINCGSCRAPARLRRRRHRRYPRCLTHRFRSLAEARQLPQGIGFVGQGQLPARQLGVPATKASIAQRVLAGMCAAVGQITWIGAGWSRYVGSTASSWPRST